MEFCRPTRASHERHDPRQDQLPPASPTPPWVDRATAPHQPLPHHQRGVAHGAVLHSDLEPVIAARPHRSHGLYAGVQREYGDRAPHVVENPPELGKGLWIIN